MTNRILTILKEQRQMHMKGSLYHKVQIDLTYNSNHIEGSKLTHEQTRYIFETGSTTAVFKTGPQSPVTCATPA